MGLGPIEASRRALARAGMTIDDIDLVEINEAVAAQVIGSARELAVTRQDGWTRRLTPRSVGTVGRDRWLDAASTVAAYRDRYKVTSDLPVGGAAKNDSQQADRQRALAALRAARSANAPERPASVQKVDGRAT
jgi:hypothetical protein